MPWAAAMKPSFRCLLITVATTGPLAAESAPDRADAFLEEIVVTATRSEKVLRINPFSVDVLGTDELTVSTEDQLADIIASLPGVAVSDAGQAGQKRVLIRGEEARRMAFLVDGQEFMDHREVGVPLLVDPNRIQRIEIVRGPASVLYGGKALAGVVNVITHREVDQPLLSNLSLTLNGSTNGHNVSGQFYGKLPAGTTWNLGAFNNDHGFRKTPSGQVENTAYASHGVNAGIGHTQNEHAWHIAFEDFRAKSDVFVEPEVRFSPPFRDFSIEIPHRDRQKLRGDYQFMPTGRAMQSISVDVYRQISNREFNTETRMTLAPGFDVDTGIFTLSDLVSDGINLQSNWDMGKVATLVAGGQWSRDEVHQTRLREVVTNGLLTSKELTGDAAQLTTAALYLQADIEINEQLALIGGTRAYWVTSRQLPTDLALIASHKGNVRDTHTIASLGAIYTLHSGNVLRVTWSEGYIFPSLMNLTIGAYAGASFINPVSTLSPETSDTFELGYRTGSRSLSLDSVVFLARSRNYIDHLPCATADDCPGARDRIYRNIGRADTHGLEINARLSGDAGQIDAGLTWLRRRKQYDGIDSYSSGVPSLLGHLTMTVSRRLANQPVQYWLTGRFESSSRELTATRNGTSLAANPGHVVYDAGINWTPQPHLDIVLVAANLADRDYHSATQNLSAPGRHLRLRINYSL